MRVVRIRAVLLAVLVAVLGAVLVELFASAEGDAGLVAVDVAVARAVLVAVHVAMVVAVLALMLVTVVSGFAVVMLVNVGRHLSSLSSLLNPTVDPQELFTPQKQVSIRCRKLILGCIPVLSSRRPVRTHPHCRKTGRRASNALTAPTPNTALKAASASRYVPDVSKT